MLSERNLQLLTAFVDGEMTRRQRKLALRLLHRSSQARSVLQELQEGAHRLRALPRRQLGSAFAGQVVHAIAERGLRIDSPRTRYGSPRRWLGYLAAACVLVGVGVGIYLANRAQPSGETNVVARVDPVPSPDRPLRVTFRELATKPKQDLVAQRLQKESAVHLELTVRNNATAVSEVRQALEGQGIKTIVDAAARVKLEQGAQRKVTYFVYAENVEAKELETMLRQLADDPKNQAAQAGTFESVVVAELNHQDRENLSALFGVKSADFETPMRKGDLFDNTIVAMPKDKKPALRAPGRPERFAMILASADGTGPSDEAKAFIAGRAQQRPGTMQVLLVIRQA